MIKTIERMFRNVSFTLGGALSLLLLLNGFGLQTVFIQSDPEQHMVYYTTGLGEVLIWMTAGFFVLWVILRIVSARSAFDEL